MHLSSDTSTIPAARCRHTSSLSPCLARLHLLLRQDISTSLSSNLSGIDTTTTTTTTIDDTWSSYADFIPQEIKSLDRINQYRTLLPRAACRSQPRRVKLLPVDLASGSLVLVRGPSSDSVDPTTSQQASSNQHRRLNLSLQPPAGDDVKTTRATTRCTPPAFFDSTIRISQTRPHILT